MGGQRRNDSWFSSLWRASRNKTSEPEKAVVGILAFEVVSMMLKVIKLWHSSTDREFRRLKDEVQCSIGLRHLVSEDEDYLVDLALSEMMDDLVYVARAVVRLGMRCTDPVFHRLELFLNDPVQYELEWSGWQYKSKKMDRKVKKMEGFVGIMLQFAQEQDVLVELEQTLRTMRANTETDQVKLLEFQQKVMWQRQEVKNLQELSPWTKTYDYVVRLLARSLFTLIERIKNLFGNGQVSSAEASDYNGVNSNSVSRTQSFSAIMHSPVYPSEDNLCGFYSGPLGMSSSKSVLTSASRKKQLAHHRSGSIQANFLHSKSKKLAPVGPFKGCMNGGSNSPVIERHRVAFGGSMRVSGVCKDDIEKMGCSDRRFQPQSNRVYAKLALLYSKCGSISAPPCTLGDAALAFHYARVIILIEKLASAPHLISIDARDDLYNMLSNSLRTVLRARLRSYARSLASSIYDASLAAQWNLSVAQMLEWLAPLAHNTIKWQSERNIEKQHEVSGTSVHLVQTLCFANQAKTETAIVELLVGLNYLSRISGDMKGRSLASFTGQRASNDYLVKMNEMALDVI
ncbi:protein PSK SIMULATOR 1-like [Syzygium oleosum]|uniref:protein PSK SIMULATOR 1-like n=1 Tax=Syzygium oleosum TaxID=219896 RepID=UPI0011D1AC01|nr:protein PSK SIMULATOR 1-like [Syzygium oleosum]XP_056159640.1 protein PSK SIMULATOR 1-like [Syzygium oleosum]